MFKISVIALHVLLYAFSLPGFAGQICVTNYSSDVTISYVPPSNVQNHASVIQLRRGNEKAEIPLGTGAHPRALTSAESAPMVYFLLSRRSVAKHGTAINDDSLQRLELPRVDESLSEARLVCVVRMEELAIGGRESWISDIERVSEDGTMLLVRRAIPIVVNEFTTRIAYETQLYDAETATLRPVSFPTRESKQRQIGDQEP